MGARKFILPFVCFSLCASLAFAQFDVQADLYEDDISVFFINEIYLNKTDRSPLLFWIEITNHLSKAQNVQLKLSIHFNGFSYGKDMLADGITTPFKLAPGRLKMNNQQLFSSNNRYRLRDYTINSKASAELRKAMYMTGELPLGVYEFEIALINEQEPATNTYYNLIIEKTTPISIHLTAPGGLASSDDIQEVYLTQPLFRWESDASEFRLKVCEKKNNDRITEDVMKNERCFETTTELTSFQYPSSKARSLEPGKIYYWQVVAIGQTVKGTFELESEIRKFKVARASDNPSANHQLQVMNYLEILMGPEAVKTYFTQNGVLQSYIPSGKIFRNDSLIIIEDLSKIINEYLTGQVKITTIDVE